MSEIIRLESVQKKYKLGNTEIHALKGINFKLRKGDFRAVLGPSGSGKSTLLQLVATLDKPDDGKIFFVDQDLSLLSEDQKSDLRNRNITMIFQSFNLIPSLTVQENVYLPLSVRNDLTESEKNQRVQSALNDVGLSDFLKNQPDQLSGGQRQRVAIARALVPGPELILADEPTANLDTKTAHQIIDLLLDLNQKRQVTFLFATHDEKLISRVRDLTWIEDGQLRAN
ncbi:MAG: ABC transporter ATP-binding protein [Deltaproteobacteria bacterium]|nr:ABC transporter ATP-binding protein [Deltaproteobacteria bacterium]